MCPSTTQVTYTALNGTEACDLMEGPRSFLAWSELSAGVGFRCWVEGVVLCPSPGMQVLEWNAILLNGKTYEEVHGLVGQQCAEAEICVRL